MITQAARPISHTTITKQPAAGIRIQGPANGPRLLNTHLRGPVHQTNLPQPNTNSPQIQHGGPTHAVIEFNEITLLNYHLKLKTVPYTLSYLTL